MKLIIDRFEGDTAVCETEDGGHVDIDRALLPDGIREGEVVSENDGSYFALTDETAARREIMRNKLKELWEG